ncbi:acyl carrier protein [Streptomyces sp. DSM 118878]
MTTPGASEAEIRQWLAGRIGHLMGREGQDVPPDLLLAEYGVDSLQAVSLIGEIEDRWGLTLDAALTWEYPTIALLAEFLAAEIAVDAVG